MTGPLPMSAVRALERLARAKHPDYIWRVSAVEDDLDPVAHRRAATPPAAPDDDPGDEAA